MGVFLVPVVCACAGLAVRYATTRIVGDLKDTLGLSVKKNLRECVYNKIVRLGVRSTDDMSMAGLTQIALEGVEQLDLYYSSHLPQFFYAMLAPLLFVCHYRRHFVARGFGAFVLCSVDPAIH